MSDKRVDLSAKVSVERFLLSDIWGPCQRGIHWPSCIDRSCEGCMPNFVADLQPPTRCAPALGIHDNCDHEEGE